MEDAAGWIAPAATMIAAMMTAANLGARFTGAGFVVFTVGSVAWTIVGAASGQQNLITSNAFLTLVNLVGIWRWLGRQAKFEDSAKAEEASSGARLIAASTLPDRPVERPGGERVATVVDAILDSDGGGRIDHLIIREGGVAGVGETLRLLPWRDVQIDAGRILTRADIARLREAG